MHSDVFKGMENSEWERASMCVCVRARNCMRRETNYISKLYFKWGTTNHCPCLIWRLQKWEQALAVRMHVHMPIQTQKHKHILYLWQLIHSMPSYIRSFFFPPLVMAAALPSRWGCNKNIDSGQTNSCRLTDWAEVASKQHKKYQYRSSQINSHQLTDTGMDL